MQKIGFEEAVVRIRQEDGRYDPDAYFFLRDALDHSVRAKQEKMGEEYPHVAGAELLCGFRELALEEFGPMAMTVLNVWGLTCSEDVGKMVFQLIEMGAFGQSEDDSMDDFKDIFSFDEAFSEPFRPRKKVQSRSKREAAEDDPEIKTRRQEVGNQRRSGDSQKQATKGNLEQ